MRQDLFRKVALDKLSSPEQLDQLITVVSPRAWFALAAIGAIMVTAALWGIFGSIPTRVYGQGIVTKSYGVYNIIPAGSGRITDIRVSVGDQVKKGDVVARIEQPRLVEQINGLQDQLENLRNFDVNGPGPGEKKFLGPELYDLYELAGKIREARAALPYEEANYKNALSGKEHEIEIARITLRQARVNEANKQEYVDKLTWLYQNGAIAEIDLTGAKKDLELLRLQTRAAEEDLAKLTAGEWEETIITYRAKLQQAQLQLQLLEEKFDTTKAVKITETEEKIKKLQDELNLASEVVSQVDGRVLEVRCGKGDLVQPGMPLFSLERQGRTIKTEVVMYVRAEEGKKITPGMEAMISPTTVKKEEYGYMLGRVVSVSEYPATGQGMLHTLGNEDLVRKLAAQGASLELHIDLIADDSTTSGFKWSSPKGPPLKINSGTLCDGSVKVMEQRPVSLVIPALKKILSVN
ncbi:MAG: NHLP bacteriocin system secretion protein [Peptococcaceae bacterium]|uniref:Membrane-fusion protein n=1 Tax=Pelotomaculum thermopropionicum (strain DSM 13744 / JCM 10971 / SI) TaxID=370438 RepID=A5CZN6_PELTS|nr:NHLP bacteriocin system secretion protein [Peptococcaceae bacterium]BAF60562.1 membrane-fusion protein [Pelotomaculum thermopropionicum SI]